MSSQHETIFAALKAHLVLTYPTLVAGDNIRLGGVEVTRHTNPPQILVVPSPEETWEAPDQIGAQFGDAPDDSRIASRAIYTVISGWSVRFWGRTRGETEALRQAWVLSTLEVAGDTLRPTRGMWTTDSDDEAADLVHGNHYRLEHELRLTISDAPVPDVDATGVADAPTGGPAAVVTDPTHEGTLSGEVGCAGGIA